MQLKVENGMLKTEIDFFQYCNIHKVVQLLLQEYNPTHKTMIKIDPIILNKKKHPSNEQL